MNDNFFIDSAKILDAIDPVQYQVNRNYLGGSTRLSVYITRGMLTLPQIRAHLATKYSTTQSYKLINELAWREYWQREWLIRSDDIFDDIKRNQDGVESDDIPLSVTSAQTGILALDTGIKQLYETGYVDNHMRMWLSGLICNIAHTKWQKPAAWMYYHLLDGDPASNTLSWQWIAGTFSSKGYLPSQENINKYTKTFQKNTIIDKSYEELAIIETPLVLNKRSTEELVWSSPKSDMLTIDKAKKTLLYHSFWLNKDWQKDIDANRILVLEPKWFARFPVSKKVTDAIIQIAKKIPQMQIYVGNIEELLPQLGAEINYMSHPSAVGWPKQADQMPLLFPEVPLTSYNSFTGYWKQCEKYL